MRHFTEFNFDSLDLFEFGLKLRDFPRSLTGPGNRETLASIKELLPSLEIMEVSTGEKVFDWEIPEEWSVTQAYIESPDGRRICDFSEHPLHLVGYSESFSGVISKDELQAHLFSIESQPDVIPYVTSYFNKLWGFSISQSQRDSLPDGFYNVVVDTQFSDGSLSYGELVIPGESSEEVIFTTYICHPWMANNEISGIVVNTYLARWLSEQPDLHYTYRFLFVPETLGTIAYLARDLARLRKCFVAGFVLTCVGDDRGYSFLPSKLGDSFSDKIARAVFRSLGLNPVVYPWSSRGSDERQYCSVGVDLPVCSMMRTKYGEYKEYHTSADSFGEVVTPSGLMGGLSMQVMASKILETNWKFRCVKICEPFMSKYGLYPTTSTLASYAKSAGYMDILSWCDGKNDLVDISELTDIPYWDVVRDSHELFSKGLVQKE